MGEVYQMDIAGCKRELPICPLNEHMDIAGFVMFSDVEITEKTAKALLEKCPEHDIIVTAESKGIPLAYEMARIGCRNYVVARDVYKRQVTNLAVQEEFRHCNAYARPECRDCWAKLYCSGGCAANAYHATGKISGVYEYGCELFKKRIECAVMMQVAESEEA